MRGVVESLPMECERRRTWFASQYKCTVLSLAIDLSHFGKACLQGVEQLCVIKAGKI